MAERSPQTTPEEEESLLLALDQDQDYKNRVLPWQPSIPSKVFFILLLVLLLWSKNELPTVVVALSCHDSADFRKDTHSLNGPNHCRCWRRKGPKSGLGRALATDRRPEGKVENETFRIRCTCAAESATICKHTTTAGFVPGGWWGYS